jgi:hypothetical protein
MKPYIIPRQPYKLPHPKPTLQEQLEDRKVAVSVPAIQINGGNKAAYFRPRKAVPFLLTLDTVGLEIVSKYAPVKAFVKNEFGEGFYCCDVSVD